MIIGLNGRLKSGKDTTFNIIQEVVTVGPVIQVSFAKALKVSAAASVGSNVVSMENWKGDESIHFTRPDGSTFTTREYLQWFGTEGHRDAFGDNFWVDIALPLDKDYSDALYVVTDMRFPNEADRVIALGGHAVKVEREAATNFSAHSSEQNIDDVIEYFLDNTGTLDDLRHNVTSMLVSFGVPFPDLTKDEVVSLFPTKISLAEGEAMRGWGD